MIEEQEDLDRLHHVICDAFSAIGLHNGDTILCHSNTDVLDAHLPNAEISVQLGILERALRDTVGPMGTVVVPTFTYGFCKGRRFDPAKTTSHVGLFSNWMRRRPDAVRSEHPIFSFSAVGVQALTLMADVPESAFDEDSVFGRLRRTDAKILFFNCPFDNCTFVHHIEKMHGVDYRYDKVFTGQVRKDGVWSEGSASHFVRPLDRDVENSFRRFSESAERDGILKFARLGEHGFVSVASSQRLFDAGCRAIDEEPYIFLSAPPLDPRK